MNIKQLFKFIALSIVFQLAFAFIAGMIVGYVETILQKSGWNMSVPRIAGEIIALLTVVPAIFVSAQVTYKNAPVLKSQVVKIASATAAVSLVLSCLLLFVQTIDAKTVTFNVMDILLTFSATYLFVKKYSETINA